MNFHVLFLLTFLLGKNVNAMTVAADDLNYVQYVGRTRRPGDGTVRYDWNGVEARVLITNANFISININATISQTSTTRARIYIEDQNFSYPVSYIFITPLITNYLLASGLGGITRMIRLVEIEEPPYMNSGLNMDIQIVSFETDGIFQSIASRSLSRSLVFIGDSITAATNIVAFPPCGDSGFQSDYTLSYSSLLCNNFSANCSNIAIGGKGLIANCCDNGPTMTSYFLQTEYGTVKPDWNFTQERIPDGIIINLGTNDFSKNSGPDFEASFTQGYIDFMVNITNYYQSKKIAFFCGVGPMTQSYLNATLNAVNGAKNLGLNVNYINMYGPPNDGCAGHPGIQGHYGMFIQSQPIIATVLGW